MSDTALHERKPPWLTVRLPSGPTFAHVRDLMRSKALHTVCEEAHCPNMGECWGAGTATFMILGEVCTRACSYCAVTSGRPHGLDEDEPRRVGLAVQQMRLQHAVVTSVNRDDLPDGGARIFAATIRWIRRLSPHTTVEVLIPDFLGDRDALAVVMAGRPDVLNHNTETVPRLYPRVRHKADYQRTLAVLRGAKELWPGARTKTGVMLGLGERDDELRAVFHDLRAVDCDVLTLGQYLRPTPRHAAVAKYYHPDEFVALRQEALRLGFVHVESGSLVRSSYHAERHAVRRDSAAVAEVAVPLTPVERPETR